MPHIFYCRFLKAACDSQSSSVGEIYHDEEEIENEEDETKHPTPVSLATPMDLLVTPSYATKDALISEEFPVVKKQDARLNGWMTTNEKVLFLILGINLTSQNYTCEVSFTFLKSQWDLIYTRTKS